MEIKFDPLLFIYNLKSLVVVVVVGFVREICKSQGLVNYLFVLLFFKAAFPTLFNTAEIYSRCTMCYCCAMSE